MQIWSLRIWRRRLFARTAWNGCRRGRFKRERALRRERETEEETDREIREIERANAGTRIQNRTQNPIAQTGERRSSVSFLAPKKNIYIRRERHSNPPRGPLDATLKIEIERRHRAKDESNDAPRESQQSTIRQTFVLSYSFVRA